MLNMSKAALCIIFLLVNVIHLEASAPQITTHSYKLKNLYNGSQVISAAEIVIYFDQDIYVHDDSGNLMLISQAYEIDRTTGSIYLWKALAGSVTFTYNSVIALGSSLSDPIIPLFGSADPLADLPHYDQNLRSHFYAPRKDSSIAFLVLYKKTVYNVSTVVLPGVDTSNGPSIEFKGRLYSSSDEPFFGIYPIQRRNRLSCTNYDEIARFGSDLLSLQNNIVPKVDAHPVYISQLQGDVASLESREVIISCFDYALTLANYSRYTPTNTAPLQSCSKTDPLSATQPSSLLISENSINFNTAANDPCCNPTVGETTCCAAASSSTSFTTSYYRFDRLATSTCQSPEVVETLLRDFVYYTNVPPVNTNTDFIGLFRKIFSAHVFCEDLLERPCISLDDCLPGSECRAGVCSVAGDKIGAVLAACYVANFAPELETQLKTDFNLCKTATQDALLQALIRNITADDCFGPDIDNNYRNDYVLSTKGEDYELIYVPGDPAGCSTNDQICNFDSTISDGSTCANQFNKGGVCVRCALTDCRVVPGVSNGVACSALNCLNPNDGTISNDLKCSSVCSSSCWQCGTTNPNILSGVCASNSTPTCNGAGEYSDSKGNCYNGVNNLLCGKTQGWSWVTCSSSLDTCRQSQFQEVLKCEPLPSTCPDIPSCNNSGKCSDFYTLSKVTNGVRSFGKCLVPIPATSPFSTVLTNALTSTSLTIKSLSSSTLSLCGFPLEPAGKFSGYCFDPRKNNITMCAAVRGKWVEPSLTPQQCSSQLFDCLDRAGGTPKSTAECSKCGGTVIPSFHWESATSDTYPASAQWVATSQMVPKNVWMQAPSLTELKHRVTLSAVSFVASRVSDYMTTRYSHVYSLLQQIVCNCGNFSNCDSSSQILIKTVQGSISDTDLYPRGYSATGSVKVNNGCNTKVSIYNTLCVHCLVQPEAPTTTAISTTTGNQPTFNGGLIGNGLELRSGSATNCDIALLIRDDFPMDPSWDTYGIAEHDIDNTLVLRNTQVTKDESLLRGIVPCTGTYFPVAYAAPVTSTTTSSSTSASSSSSGGSTSSASTSASTSSSSSTSIIFATSSSTSTSSSTGGGSTSSSSTSGSTSSTSSTGSTSSDSTSSSSSSTGSTSSDSSTDSSTSSSSTSSSSTASATSTTSLTSTTATDGSVYNKPQLILLFVVLVVVVNWIN